MAHPCAGHACDHCLCCDVVGICCGTIPAEVQARLEAAVQRDDLRAAILAESAAVPSLRDLVRAEYLSPPKQRPQQLPAAPALGLPRAAEPILNHDSRKEAIYVVPARQTR